MKGNGSAYRPICYIKNIKDQKTNQFSKVPKSVKQCNNWFYIIDRLLSPATQILYCETRSIHFYFLHFVRKIITISIYKWIGAKTMYLIGFFLPKFWLPFLTALVMHIILHLKFLSYYIVPSLDYIFSLLFILQKIVKESKSSFQNNRRPAYDS